ncbi:ATP-dependent protease subunit HslV [Hondaea fermentalgiana]|uniref:ATP-dependent protease subunit HslV n=1 Tax=Hondaea fermentalgiana TaxID=2315210 RepID=A0A2R5GY53_9STRA|nr:ATP-dependent protease subunit HslV [Hondaea fermentalgiana]|eukprot:GBG32904.1 ATP-dependent protease subunit HslV [Hondaea fermentalgiana]
MAAPRLSTVSRGAAMATPLRSVGVARAMSSSAFSNEMHGTTILSVRRGGKVVVIGDGQISQGNSVVKGNAIKVRRLGGSSDKNGGENVVLAGFAGATADALTLLDRLEKKLEQYPGQLTRSCVELAKLWRTDKYLRRLEAIMIVVDKDVSLTLTGNGDVLHSPDGVIAVGSGGLFALSAARALSGLDAPDLSAEEIAKRSMDVASELCVFTNSNYTMETIEASSESKVPSA